MPFKFDKPTLILMGITGAIAAAAIASGNGGGSAPVPSSLSAVQRQALVAGAPADRDSGDSISGSAEIPSQFSYLPTGVYDFRAGRMCADSGLRCGSDP